VVSLPARWSELATTDFADPALRGAVAILPVAAIEQHGPHLPLGTDAIINQGIVDAALTLLDPGGPAVLLPALAVGTSAEHLSFPGTITLDPATLARTWTACAEAVHRAGLRKLLVFNSHGGQSGLIETVAVDLRARLGMLVAWASPGAFGVPEGTVDATEAAHGLHGGLKETAMMLHLRPDLVRAEALARFPSLGEEMARTFRWLKPTGRTGFGWLAKDLNPTGVVGNAAAATAALGAALVVRAAEGLAELVRELARFDLTR
jgi:creatinine amidohydrolase